MARKKQINVTKAQIVRVATSRFMEVGYSSTTCKSIGDALGISTGHITFYYPTKEHMLAVLVEMLCDFQWKMMNRMVDGGTGELTAFCLELTAMAAICEENQIGKEFYISAYTHPMPLEIIRRNDAARAEKVFADQCSGWTAERFTEAENLVSGIEYAILMTTGDSPPLPVRIRGALEQILLIYEVPEEIRKREIQRVLELDYRGIGKTMLNDFTQYIKEVNEQTLDDLLNLLKGGY